MPELLKGFPDVLKCCKLIHFIYFFIAIQLSSVVWAGDKTVSSGESSIEKKIGDLNNTFPSFGAEELDGNNTYFSEFESESAINDSNFLQMKNFIMSKTNFPLSFHTRSLSPNGKAFFKSVEKVLKKLVADLVDAKNLNCLINIYNKLSKVEYDVRTREMELITDKEALNIANNLINDFRLLKFVIKQAFLARGMQILQEFIEECETLLSYPVISNIFAWSTSNYPKEKLVDLKKYLLQLKDDLKRVRDVWTVNHLTMIPPTFTRILVLLQNLKTLKPPSLYLNGLYSRLEYSGFQITIMADCLIA